MAEDTVFTNIQRVDPTANTNVAVNGSQILNNLSKLSTGIGSKVFRMDKQGLWLGAVKFTDAPFAVDMLGNMAAKSATFKKGDGTVIIDGGGIVSTAGFQKGIYSANPLSPTSHTGTFSYIDVSGSTLTLTLDRSANVLISLFANVKIYADDPIRGFHIDVSYSLDGVTQAAYARFEVSRMNSDLSCTISLIDPILLAAGTHTFTLQWSGFTDVAGICEMYYRQLNYLVLGT